MSPCGYPLKGILLYGPPGCSKTMFVQALVHETGFNYYPLKVSWIKIKWNSHYASKAIYININHWYFKFQCSNLLSKFVGETEKSLTQVFKIAEAGAPSIIFIDEIDSLCGDRSGSGKGLVSELLSLLSKVKKKGNVMLIGATNRPHALDDVSFTKYLLV